MRALGERATDSEGVRNAAAAALEMAITALPRDYASRRNSLGQLHDAIRTEIAIALQPSLNEHLKTMPHETYEDKKALAIWVNAQLRGLGLAVKDPKSGKPSSLLGDRGNRHAFGRFKFRYQTDAGVWVTGATSVSLPVLEPVPDDLSRVQGVRIEGPAR